MMVWQPVQGLGVAAGELLTIEAGPVIVIEGPDPLEYPDGVVTVPRSVGRRIEQDRRPGDPLVVPAGTKFIHQRWPVLARFRSAPGIQVELIRTRTEDEALALVAEAVRDMRAQAHG